jgi:cell division protein FtsL
MRVQFDLRPASLLEKERKRTSFNVIRIVAFVLLAVFLLTTVGYVGWMTTQMINLQSNIDDLLGNVENMEGERMALAAEINRLREQERTYANTLKIMQDDLPTLEVLNAFEENMAYGLGLNTFRFTNPAQGGGTMAVLEATAATEEQITLLSDNLKACGVFSDVNMPTSRRDERTGRVSFTLNLVALPIGQIKSGNR